jgi:hypothetical protein
MMMAIVQPIASSRSALKMQLTAFSRPSGTNDQTIFHSPVQAEAGKDEDTLLGAMLSRPKMSWQKQDVSEDRESMAHGA